MLKIGDKAPSFELKDQSGRIRSLEEFMGRWIVLYFYPKDNTPGCTQEACDFSLNIADFEGLKSLVIGISKDSVESHKKFADEFNLKIILLSDPGHEIIEKYGVWREKKFMGKTSLGIVLTSFIFGRDGKIAHAWDNVSVKGHIEEVRMKLKELE